MEWYNWFLPSAVTAALVDALVGVAKQSPPYLFAPYWRLLKETLFLRKVLRSSRFETWKSEADRYVTVRAIKASGAHQEQPQPVLDTIETFLKRGEPSVLLGEPGAGKTTVLEALTYRLARSAYRHDIAVWAISVFVFGLLFYLAWPIAVLWLVSFSVCEIFGRRATVPLFIDARSDYGGGDVSDWYEKIMKVSLGEKPIFGSRSHAVFLVDGTNEVQADLHGTFVEGWRALLRPTREPKRPLRAILTSRIGEDPSPALGLETPMTVCELDDASVEEFLKVYGREKTAVHAEQYAPEQAKLDIQQLKAKGLLEKSGIGRNPYWLKMIVESGVYTRNQGILFQRFAERLIQREILEKPEGRKRKPDWKTVPIDVQMDALAALALAMHHQKRIGFIDELGWNTGRKAIREDIGDLLYSPDDVLNEGEAATLLRVELKKRVEFAHQLLQEFFAAYGMRSEAKWQNALACCEDTWWWKTLIFLGGILAGADGSQEAYTRFGQQVLGDGSNEKRVFLAMGLLRSVENAPSTFSAAVIEKFVWSVTRRLEFYTWQPKLNLTEDQRDAIRGLRRAFGDEAIAVFAKLWDHPNDEAQIAAVWLLSELGGESAIELIIKKLNSISPSIGVEPLVSMGSKAVEPIIKALESDDKGAWRCAAEALGRISDRRALETLIAKLLDNRVGSLAAKALGQIRDERVVEPLISALRDGSEGVRYNAVKALGMIGDPRAVDPLVAVLRYGNTLVPIPTIGQDHRVLWHAANALVSIGEPAVEPLIDILSDEDEQACCRAAYALREIGDPRAAEQLQAVELRIASVRNLEWESEFRGLRISQRIPESVESHIAALRDGSPEVRWQAAYALGKFHDLQAWEELKRVAREDHAQTTFGTVSDAARTALQRLRRKVESHIDGLRDRDPKYRWRAAFYLGEIGVPEALEELEQVARYDHVESDFGIVADAAREAIRKIQQRQRRQKL